MKFGNLTSFLIFFITASVSLFLFYYLKKINNTETTLYFFNNSFTLKKFYIYFGLLVCAFPLAMLLGFRTVNIGTDTSYTYYPYYYLGYCIKGTKYDGIEYGFYYLFKLCFYLTGSFNGCLFIIGYITVYLYLLAIYKISTKSTSILSFVVYISLYYMFEYNIMRQALAMGIILNGLNDLMNTNTKKFVLLVIIASLFHTSALACLLILFFYYTQDLAKIYKIIIFFGVFVGLIFLSDFISSLGTLSVFEKFSTNYSSYGNLKFSISNFIRAFKGLVFDIPLLFIFLNAKNSLYDEKNYYVSEMMLVTMVGLWLCVPENVVLMRLTYYFELAYFFCLPSVLPAYDLDINNIKKKQFLNVSAVFLVLFLRFFIFYFLLGYDGIVPYEII